MLRLSLAAMLSISGALALVPQSHAGNAWQEDRKLSKQYAGKEEWSVLAAMASWPMQP